MLCMSWMKHNCPIQRIVFAVLTVLIVTGCGRENTGGTAEKGRAPAIKRRTIDDLPPIGEYLPPLDAGKVEIAPPANWNRIPRGSKWLAAFCKGKVSDLPRITVDADFPPPSFGDDVTEDNVDALADALNKQLATERRKVEEPCRPIILGDTLFLRHVRLAQGPAVIQSLQTVRNGRLYTVELIADVNAPRHEEYDASLTQYRDFGYAVAANMKFAEDSSPVSPADAALAEKEKSADAAKSEPAETEELKKSAKSKQKKM